MIYLIGRQYDTLPATLEGHCVIAVSASAIRTAKVSLAGLDLSTPQDARTAYERIKATAERLCFQLSDSHRIDYQAVYDGRVIETLADTVRRINVPTLAALEK